MTNPALEAQEKQAKEAYKTSKAQFETDEKQAHDKYVEYKDMGMVQEGQDFYRWIPMNAPNVAAAKQNMENAASQLSNIWNQSEDPKERERGSWFFDPWVVLPGRQSARTYDEDVDGRRAIEQAEVDKHLRLD